ncbi:hypothetical protein [Microbulbifer halophilus]|uniref:hypothetical protein n=1 Tax=Microbulbifer halophilus TaxID=453963 RepID=UPI003613F68E
MLTEGPAIVQYLADLKPEKGLAPPPASWQRVRLQEWLNFITSELHAGPHRFSTSHFRTRWRPSSGKNCASDSIRCKKPCPSVHPLAVDATAIARMARKGTSR